jgi:hypothetical protein
MRLAFTITVILLLLTVNYLCGWSYPERQPGFSANGDSITVNASNAYNHLTPLKWIFLGENYRREWSEPVTMPVFRLQRTMGGLKIIRLGGGQQTRSLHLEDSSGNRWVLRTIDKDVRPAVPEKIRNSFIIGIVQDQVSAAHPYAPLAVKSLSDAAGIPAMDLVLYYVPDDTNLGSVRKLFAGCICFLEKAMPEGVSYVESTEGLRSLMAQTGKVQVAQEQLLRARLLDMLIADWDRHDRQWDWIAMDSAGVRYYSPIPEDRDQAFFRSDGLLTRAIKAIDMPHLTGFRPDGDRLDELNHKAIAFDRFFLSGLDRQDWLRIIKTFRSRISDEVLQKAVIRLPPEVRKIRGDQILATLRSRRDGLLINGLAYYKELASQAQINTSSDAERISVMRSKDTVCIEIKDASNDRIVYSRRFNSGETWKIDLNGVSENDVVEMRGAEHSSIEVNINYRKP